MSLWLGDWTLGATWVLIKWQTNTSYTITKFRWILSDGKEERSMLIIIQPVFAPIQKCPRTSSAGNNKKAGLVMTIMLISNQKEKQEISKGGLRGQFPLEQCILLETKLWMVMHLRSTYALNMSSPKMLYCSFCTKCS